MGQGDTRKENDETRSRLATWLDCGVLYRPQWRLPLRAKRLPCFLKFSLSWRRENRNRGMSIET